MFGEEETGTQELESQQGNEGAQGTTNSEGEGANGQGAQGQDEYFLTVNDRTKYRTSQDAVRAFDEAGRRIAQLSPWEKEVSQKFGGLTPQQTQALLFEYIQLKQAAQPQTGNSGNGNAGNGNGQTPQSGQLTPEEREAVEFIKQHGFVTKEDVRELQQMLEELRTGTQSLQEQTETERFNSLVETGRGVLREELIAGKFIPARFGTEQEQQKATRFMRNVENLASAYIDADRERIERFKAGGDETKGVVREAIRDAIESLGLQPPQGNPLASAQRKATVLNRNPQPLPAGGSAGQRPAKTGNEGLTADVHRRAADLFERIAAGQNAE